MLIAKVKVMLSLCLIKYHAMKTYWRSGGIALHGGEWSASCLVTLPMGKESMVSNDLK
jgi:hypothetical protein